MKKLLLSYDEYAYKLNGQYYLKEFGHILLLRYLNIFDSLKVVIRTKNAIDESELGVYNIPLTDSRIEIVPVPFFQGPVQYIVKFLMINKVIKNVEKDCSAALFRIPSTIGFAVLNSIKKTGLPYGVEVIANPIEMAKSVKNVFIRILMTIIHYQQKSACKYADCASYVTENMLQKVYPAIKNGHFESFYSSVQLSDSFYSAPRKYPNHKPFIICHVANPIKTKTKGHVTVINVVKLLIHSGYDVIAYFAGQGEFVSYFEQKAVSLGVNNNIKFVGLLKQEELKVFLEKSDLMLFPSKSEGLPRVLIEAMATGLPCLSTPIGGIPELIPTELIFAPDDTVGFANMITKIIDDEILYTKFSEQAFNKAIEYRLNALQKRRNDFYLKLKEINN
jgi:Glycosyltransferase